MSRKTAMKKYRGGLAAKGLAKIALVASSRPEKQEILRKIAAKQRAEEKTGEISMTVTAEEKAALAEVMTDEEFTAPVVVFEKIEALALRLFEQRLKETIGGTEEVARWAVEGANTFYQALGSDE